MNRQSPRLRRLRSDLLALTRLKSESSILDFDKYGEPPDSFLIKFRGRGLYRPSGNQRIMIATEHQVAVKLGAAYPRMMPELQWRTPIFHPNISGSGVVCLGGYGTHWVPSLGLDELCEMLWDMIRYKNYDPESPYNREAANWARLQSDFRFPLDPRPLRDRVASGQVASAPAPGTGPGKPAEPAQPSPPASPSDITFLDDNSTIVEAQVVDEGDSEILIIE